MIEPKAKRYVGSNLGPSRTFEPGSSHRAMLDLTGGGKRVLEFGCASGYMSRALADAGCRVTGVEIDPVAAAEARTFCEDVLVADLDVRRLADVLPPVEYDVAVFGDVLEHLHDPWRVLDEARPFLSYDGYAVLSIPNVAHGSVRLALLSGNFDYVDMGLLDQTHLRFFTLASVRALCLRAGYRVESIERTKVPMFEPSTSHPIVRREDFDEATIARIERDPEHDTLQFIVKAVPLDDRSRYAWAVDRILELEAALGPDRRRRDAELDDLRARAAELDERHAATRLELATAKQAAVFAERDRTLLQMAIDDRTRTMRTMRLEIDEVDGALASGRREAVELREELARERAAAGDYAELERGYAAVVARFTAHVQAEIDRTRAHSAEVDATITAVRRSPFWTVKRIVNTVLRRSP